MGTGERYFLIQNSEDGLPSVTDMTNQMEDLLYPEKMKGWCGLTGFYTKMPEGSPDEWDPELGLLIKGKIVVVKSKKVVTQYSIEEED